MSQSLIVVSFIRTIYIGIAFTKSDSLVLYGVNSDMYSKPGDINIGSIMSLTRGLQDNVCTNTPIPGSWGIEYPESIAFAVDAANKNPDLLPNLTLGFYILDDCSSRSMALAQALSFIPRSGVKCIAGDDSTIDSLTQSGSPFASDIEYFKVVGIVSPMFSTSAVPVSYLYTTARLPLVGFSATSDELSDKSLHPNYVRVIIPDKYQALAMLKFIRDNGWTYVSVVYSQGPYGEGAYDVIKSSAVSFNICLAVSHRVMDSEDIKLVGESLLRFSKARVVILFMDIGPTLRLLDYIAQFNASGQFIWIFSDSITGTTKEDLMPYKNSVIGAFMFIAYAPLVRDFYEYVRKQDVMTPSNPWLKLSWESLFHCNFSFASCNISLDVVRDTSFGFMNTATLAMDAVLTYAYGIHNLISAKCPGVAAADAMDCIRNHSLLSYIRNVSFTGYSGPIKFNKDGDVMGKYVIYQITYDYVTVPFDYGRNAYSSKLGLVNKEVAFYDIASNSISYTSNNISWSHLIHVERIVPLLFMELDKGIPESVCSRPCVPGEYKIQKELQCCWECRTCRDNERIVNRNTSCEECLEFTWPDPLTGYTTCVDIPLTYPSMSGTLTIVQMFLAVFGLLIATVLTVLYVYFGESRVIKASSRELSLLQLAAIFIGYITVICFQTEPTPTTCTVLYFIFCISFASLYCPLFVKAVRIYRVFASGTKNNKRPKFVSPQFQVILSLSLILIQIALCIAVQLTYRPTSKRTQLVKTEKFVELTCDMTMPGLASFLTYNLVLIVLCSLFAFKTRKLPDNFNESKFISMCVSTTLVIWCAFIPTYFTASREYIKTLLQSVALLLNHTVALVFLFLPRIYAAIYVPSDSITITRFNTMNSRHFPSVNQVAPSPESFETF